MIENYRKLMYYAIITVVFFCCVQQFVIYDSFMEDFLVNYTAKGYLFEPVSYTHLDVYKRQGLHRVQRAGYEKYPRPGRGRAG